VDDFWSGSRAAITGGITTIGNMTNPVPDEDGTQETPGAAITREMAAAAPEAAVDWFLHPILLHPAALPEGEIAHLAEHGTRASRCSCPTRTSRPTSPPCSRWPAPRRRPAR
jgi:hypothetical protein